MKRCMSTVAVVLLVFPGTACRQAALADQPEEGRRLTEAAGGFSFVVPPGWEIREFQGLKYKIAVGKPASGFTPNINVQDESFNGSLEEYAQASLASLRRVLKEFRLRKQDDFKTAGGLEGKRLILESEQGGKSLRQTVYLFARGNTKFVITCSVLAEGGEKLDPVFEASMKTFRFEGK
jgi:hypothetical protein